MALSLSQQRALAMLPKVTGVVSAASSALVATIVLRDPHRRSLCYHRLVFGIALVDLSASLWLSLSTWPIPAESGTLWAVGNDTTCRVQGFFTQFGISSSFYNASLSVYFWLVVVRGWKERHLQRIEWVLHAVPILWALASACTGLALDVYANALLWCWVSTQYEKFRWGAFYGPLWVNIGIVTITCLSMFFHVRRLEMAADKHRGRLEQYQAAAAEATAPTTTETLVVPRVQLPSDVSDTNDTPSTTVASAAPATTTTTLRAKRSFRRQASSVMRRMSIYQKSQRVKAVAHQCFLYAISFYVNWAALSATRLIQTINGEVYYPLILIAAITVPMQGLPNFIIYLLPKLRKLRKRDPNAGWVFWFSRATARQPSPSVDRRRRRRRRTADDLPRLSSDGAVHNPSCVNDDDDDDLYDYDGEGAVMDDDKDNGDDDAPDNPPMEENVENG